MTPATLDIPAFNRLAHDLLHPAAVPEHAMRCVFHGCLANAIGAVRAEGLRVRRGEPSLTPNPASALWKYANPVRHSRQRYSGQARASAERLIDEGALQPGDSLDETLRRAATIWQGRLGAGAAFVLDLGPAGVTVPAEARVAMTDDGIVRGGISKWIYAHLSVPAAENAPFAVVPPSAMCGYLMTVAPWSDVFVRFHARCHATIPGHDAGDGLVARVLADRSAFTWIATSADRAAIARAIVDGLAWGFLLQEIRKLLLAFAAAAGAALVKDDVQPPETWATDPVEQAIAAFDRLRHVRYLETDVSRGRDQWVDRLYDYGNRHRLWSRRPATCGRKP